MNKVLNYLSRIKITSGFYQILVTDLIVLFLTLTFFFNFIVQPLGYPDPGENGNEFSLLANSFLSGRLDITKLQNMFLDCSFAGGKCYWALGPLPAVILMPGVFVFRLFSQIFFQGYLNFFLVVLIFILCYGLAKKFRYSVNDSLWLALAFCFASVFTGSAFNALSWYFSHALAVALLLLCLYEFFNKKRYGLIGLGLGLVLATRLTAGLGAIFFILEILFKQNAATKEKIKSLIYLLAPFLFCGLLLLLYNFLRFGSVFDTGYGRALVGWDYMRYLRAQCGLFNLSYVPTNFYYYFLKGLEPVLSNGYLVVWPYFRVSPLGLSFFIVAPVFIKIFWVKLKDKIMLYSAVTSAFILAVLLAYYSDGSWQFGPRYMLDFLPFLFLLLLAGFKGCKLASRHYWLITFSALTNFLFYLVLSWRHL